MEDTNQSSTELNKIILRPQEDKHLFLHTLRKEKILEKPKILRKVKLLLC